MIRPATSADIEHIIPLAIEALSIDPYPQLITDRLKVAKTVAHCVQSQRHFSWVSEHDGQIVGALGAVVNPNLFHEGYAAGVIMWYCRDSGDGFALMRQFRTWCRERSSIVLITYTGERGADSRVGLMAKRAGLTDQLPLYMTVQ